MKRKLSMLLIIVAIVVLAINLMKEKGNFYSELCVSEEKMQEIIENRELSKNVLCSRIMFNEYELMYDVCGNRYFYSLIEEESGSYNPYVEYEANTNNVKIAIVGEEINYNMVSDGREVVILFYTDEVYQISTIAFTTLPLLSINYEGEMEEEDTKNIKFKLFDNRVDSVRRVTNAIGEIHSRGGYSRTYPKKGYKLTLNTYSVGENQREWDISLLGMRQDGDWVLYAAYNDQEKIRNVFSTRLWKDSCATNNCCKVENGTEYRYVELFINGEYWGLYALGHRIDALQIQMAENEYMYEKENPMISEVDMNIEAEEGIEGYCIRELGKNTEESWEPLKKYYRAMFEGDNNYSALKEISDVSNCIDIFLFLNLIQGIDHANLRGENIIYNMYMTNKRCNNNQSEHIMYTPWDMDRTWGNGFDDEIYNVSAQQNILMQTNIAYLLLEQGDKDMEEAVMKRYRELRESFWSEEYIMNLLDEYENQIYDSGAYRRDKIRWPEGNYLEEEKKLGVFKEYVKERLKYMDVFMSQYEN